MPSRKRERRAAASLEEVQEAEEAPVDTAVPSNGYLTLSAPVPYGKDGERRQFLRHSVTGEVVPAPPGEWVLGFDEGGFGYLSSTQRAPEDGEVPAAIYGFDVPRYSVHTADGAEAKWIQDREQEWPSVFEPEAPDRYLLGSRAQSVCVITGPRRPLPQNDCLFTM